VTENSQVSTNYFDLTGCSHGKLGDTYR